MEAIRFSVTGDFLYNKSLYTPSKQTPSGEYYLKSEADAEIERLEADVERLKQCIASAILMRRANLAATCPGCYEAIEDGCTHGAEFDSIIQTLEKALSGGR